MRELLRTVEVRRWAPVVLATVGGVTRPRVDPRLALLAAGLGLHLVTDLTYLVLNPAGHDREGGPVALGWLSALAVLAAAAGHRDTTRHPDRDTDRVISTHKLGRILQVEEYVRDPLTVLCAVVRGFPVGCAP